MTFGVIPFPRRGIVDFFHPAWYAAEPAGAPNESAESTWTKRCSVAAPGRGIPAGGIAPAFSLPAIKRAMIGFTFAASKCSSDSPPVICASS